MKPEQKKWTKRMYDILFNSESSLEKTKESKNSHFDVVFFNVQKYVC
jgi:hypothetical protein